MRSHGLFKDRMGKFGISIVMLEDYPGIVQEVLSTVIVVRAEHMWHTDAIEYVGISHSFEALPHGTLVPTYKPVIENNHFVKWEKVE